MSERGFQSGDLLDGKYRIDARLGQGGMGAVYRAVHLGTKRTVAVKVIHPQFSNSEEFVARFRREAEAAGRLRHPNVVDVTDFGFAQTARGTVAYLVMEYLDGCTLADVLDEEERLPIGWVIDILEQVCFAVGEAHRLGIVHRDLKPDNIWLEPNRRGGYTVKVLDFGLVKLDGATVADSDQIQAAAAHSSKPLIAAPVTESPRAKTVQSPVATSPVVAEQPTMIQTPTSGPSEEVATRLLTPVEPLPSVAVKSPVVAPLPTNDQIEEATRLMSVATDVTGDDAEEEGTLLQSNSELRATSDGLTRAGSVMGTPLYMSPEQWLGERVDARSDIYSLGVIAYRMLAGTTPFTGNLNELMTLHRTGVPEPIRKKNRKVPRKVAGLIMAALAKDPERRPETASGFGSALRAGVEGSGTLLRQAASLYSEHFPTFLKISLLAYIPLILMVAFLNFMDTFISMENISVIAGLLLFGVLALLLILANLFAYFTGSAVTIPLVIQLMVAPLRPVSIKTALTALKRRWRVFAATSLLITFLIFAGALFLVVPGIIIAISYILYAPVAVMERRGVRATLKRARQLMKRSWITVLVIALIQFALPIATWLASVHTDFTLKFDEHLNPREFGFNFSMSGHSALFQLLNILIMPLAAIMTALLYMKTRQAGGESLQDAIEQFDALEIPRSRWQAKMRSRSLSRGTALPSQETGKTSGR